MNARHIVVTAYLVGLAAAAHAGDGVREINQACALAGCFPGDTAGFPVTIVETGSYRLTGALVVPSASASGIRITDDAPSTTLDLGGFSVSGPATCTGEPAVCTGTGTGDGIYSLAAGTTVRNGTVRGMGDLGLLAGNGATYEDLVVEQNGGDGIQASAGGSRRIVVRGCRIRKNGGDGLSAGWQDGGGEYGGNLVVGNVATGNGGYGLRVSGAVVRGNVAVRNGEVGLGLFSGGESGYADNLARENDVDGFFDVNGGTEIGTNVCGDDTLCP